MNRFVQLLLCGLLITGCGELEPHPEDLLEIGRWTFKEAIDDRIEPDPLLDPSNYTIGTGDQISIEVRDRLGEIVVDASAEFSVMATGFQVLPYVGRQQIGGRSLVELREVYREGLTGAGVLREFSVEVFINRYRERTVRLDGGGVTGGLVSLPDTERRSLRVLLLTTGGVHDFADIARIEIFRPTELKTYKVDLWSMIDRGEKFFLEPDDVINVPRAPGIEVRGEVNSPGLYDWEGQRTTFRQLIAVKAGGITRFGTDDVQIRRAGEDQFWTVDYGAVNDGHLPDFVLRPGDQLWVENTEVPFLR